ncbi:hypothetical protein DdX_18719 [Ditylenchus destructor]|uniref:Uncharacterized protein n=1 Tax=Ditylenchus destructor TaxID=166010 RepID=A0AAD4ML12_9BILA|nr:hypothetical protein DdX_18719 [Ditylenchus destructor]
MLIPVIPVPRLRRGGSNPSIYGENRTAALGMAQLKNPIYKPYSKILNVPLKFDEILAPAQATKKPENPRKAKGAKAEAKAEESKTPSDSQANA